MTKNRYTKQKKSFKRVHKKDRAHCYGQKGARNTDNGARVEKKQLSEDLYYKRNKTTIGFHLF
jgi:hypothetical protein